MKEYVLKLQSLPLFVANQEAVWKNLGEKDRDYWASWLLLVDFYVRGCMYGIWVVDVDMLYIIGCSDTLDY